MMKRATLFTIFFVFLLASCKPAPVLRSGESLKLAEATESFVTVTIALEYGGSGQFALTATFAPTESRLHLYSKDIPRKGVEGLGRPTLFEIIPGSTIQALSEARENVGSEAPPSGPQDLRAYPAGTVMLRIPILLPEGNEWHDEQVSVTYMACDELGCRAPVENKLISIRIPASGLIQP